MEGTAQQRGTEEKCALGSWARLVGSDPPALNNAVPFCSQKEPRHLSVQQSPPRTQTARPQGHTLLAKLPSSLP